MVTPHELDELDIPELVDAVLVAQNRVADAVAGARPAMVCAVRLLARNYARGGRLVFVGAGTSGRLAVMEAAELPATFGIPEGRALSMLAGARRSDPRARDAAEDDEQLAVKDIATLSLDDSDTVLAVSASGTTPYTVRAAARAGRAGAAVISVSTVSDSPLATLADVAVEALTGPEVIDGSTRMAAGSAQKVVLNTLTTAAMVTIGHVHDRYMIDVVPANDKLRQRAITIAAAIADVDVARAAQALLDCGDNTRAAIIHLMLGLDPLEARRVAVAHRSLRQALSADLAQ